MAGEDIGKKDIRYHQRWVIILVGTGFLRSKGLGAQFIQIRRRVIHALARRRGFSTLFEIREKNRSKTGADDSGQHHLRTSSSALPDCSAILFKSEAWPLIFNSPPSRGRSKSRSILSARLVLFAVDPRFRPGDGLLCHRLRGGGEEGLRLAGDLLLLLLLLLEVVVTLRLRAVGGDVRRLRGEEGPGGLRRLSGGL